MTLMLRHNTKTENAISIIRDRCVAARVEHKRPHGYGHGPYFFVEGLPVDEVASGGSHHEANLYFECDLPVVKLLSRTLNSALIEGGDRSALEGKLLLCYREQHGDALDHFREAVILPTMDTERQLWNCLRFKRYEPSSLFEKMPFWQRGRMRRTADAMIASGQPFNVAVRFGP